MDVGFSLFLMTELLGSKARICLWLYPLLLKTKVRNSSSCGKESSSQLALCTSDVKIDCLFAGWWWELCCKYTLVCVGLRYTLWPKVLPVLLYISMSKKGKWPSFSVSIVNCIFSWRLLRWSKNPCSLSWPWGQIAKVSSTYLYQHVG